MTIFQAIILGIVQGLGEFLPISSSAHLIIVPWMFGFPDPGLAFDVALHAGTLIAVIIFFAKDWISIIASAFGMKVSQGTAYSKNILWLLVAATIPGAIFGALLESKAETVFRSPLLIAATLAIMGSILYALDIKGGKHKAIKEASLKDALLIGLAQAFAIIPGVSRSGSTISAGLALGFDRKSAARFSFLLSAPIIFGATILKAKYFFSPEFGSIEVAGIIAAAISGFIAISWLLKFLEKASYKAFFWYRLALAAAIVIVFFLK
ncbi:MAG: undecaprenyl-diphosphatase UppP [Candidatus Moranbacteria bacterium]|nr:undecaprenyl-diphosphatase UppP [Candidatus Moranbacteria bacterium]